MWITVVFIILITTFLVYIGVILKITIGWQRVKSFNSQPTINDTRKVSCIIAFRNEYDNLQKLINGLQQQTHNNFEVILIDDSSTDKSFALAEKLTVNLDHFILIKNTGVGKKEALAAGVLAASSDYIVFTDADCLHSDKWLQNIAQYLNTHHVDLLVGPVQLINPSNSFEEFQVVDFLSLVTSGAGAIGAKMPIMCNGANLTVSKKLWLEAQLSLKNEYASGDDIFLLQYCKAKNKQIGFIKSQEAIVKTYPEKKISAFLKQRVRWASKSKGYTDNTTLFVAWVVFITNILLLLTPLLFYIDYKLGVASIVLTLLKIAIDYILIQQGATFFKIHINVFKYVCFSIFYPIYIVISVIWAAFGMVTWKDRPLK